MCMQEYAHVDTWREISQSRRRWTDVAEPHFNDVSRDSTCCEASATDSPLMYGGELTIVPYMHVLASVCARNY